MSLTLRRGRYRYGDMAVVLTVGPMKPANRTKRGQELSRIIRVLAGRHL
jgi:hypothetical protein